MSKATPNADQPLLHPHRTLADATLWLFCRKTVISWKVQGHLLTYSLNVFNTNMPVSTPEGTLATQPSCVLEPTTSTICHQLNTVKVAASPEARCFTKSHSVSFLAMSYSSKRKRKRFEPAICRQPWIGSTGTTTEDELKKRPEDSPVFSTNPSSKTINNSKGQSVWYMRVKCSLLSPPLCQYFDSECEERKESEGTLPCKVFFHVLQKWVLPLRLHPWNRESRGSHCLLGLSD